MSDIPIRITAKEAKQMIDRGEAVMFVDTRNPQAWASSTSKIPRAVRVPADDVQNHLSELPRDRTIIAYCT